MLSAIQLDNRRSNTMQVLYERSGRTCGTYTGLWSEFTKDVAVNVRDTDYEELKKACIKAIEDTQSCMPEHHAEACIRICRNFILGEKWS